MSPDDYRHNAGRCLEAAEQLEGQSKRLMIELAAAWVRLAEHVERTIDLLGEPPPARSVGRPAVMQQQQQQPQPKKDMEPNG